MKLISTNPFGLLIKSFISLACLVLLLSLSSCREENEIYIPVTDSVPTTISEVVGFYLLNEGNMGSNKATLDYYDLKEGIYQHNIYAYTNPTVPKELGDVGNDLKIYGNRLYAVINCSNKVEVMNATNAKRIGQINIPNCRYIHFKDGYAYVSSYAGPVELDPDYKQKGYVAKVDTATLQIIDTCTVGYQPDEIEIIGNKLYVANSGGYMFPNYESTVSVIDLKSFSEIKRIEVAINLHHLRVDNYKNLWISSRGDYYDIPSRLFWVDTKKDELAGEIEIPTSNFWLDGDSLYLYSTEWNYVENKNTINYAIVNVADKKIVTRNFITDGTEKEISYPYGIMVHPVTKDIYLTDAFNHVFPGSLYIFNKEGKKTHHMRAGDIPAHFALRYEEKTEFIEFIK